MNTYMEPWTHTWPDWIRTNDGSLVRTPKMVERIVTCVNACANIPHPERLPELLRVLHSMQTDDSECFAGKIEAIGKAYRSMMGESE